MKLDPGDLGLPTVRDLASYHLRSNSWRTFSSAASGAPPLELHPKSSMDGSPRPFRSAPEFKCESPRRTAMRDAFRIRSPRQGAVSDLWAAMRGASERYKYKFWMAGCTGTDQPLRASLKCWGEAREGVPRLPQMRRSARNSSANRKKRDPSPIQGRGPPDRASPPLQ
jgi:hypothetical protein